MPELPEVETVVRSLRPLLDGRRLTAFKAVWPRVLHEVSLRRFRSSVVGQRIAGLDRRAKYVVLRLENEAHVLIHLRMTGRLYPSDDPESELKKKRKHVSAEFTLDSNETLVFHDTRRFGRIFLFPDAEAFKKFSSRFGPEPLERGFTADWLRDNLAKRKRQIKPLLLDQEFIAGLGNIYVDEALWDAGIHPLQESHRVPPDSAIRLRNAIQKTLRASIRANGTTFMNFKFLAGTEGGYTKDLMVFGRQDQPCPRCGTVIQKTRVAQRGTHICLKCQPRPKAKH